MKLKDQHLVLSPTDLANHLACGHMTELNRLVALGERERAVNDFALKHILAERGEKHEKRYIQHLAATGLGVHTVSSSSPEATAEAMRAGHDIIVQAPLGNERWYGRADVLRRIPVPSKLGDYSYEVIDTKLARETKAATILQLCLYAELIGEVQGEPPEYVYVVSPGREEEPERFRLAEYHAYHRLAKERLFQAVQIRPSTGLGRSEGETASGALRDGARSGASSGRTSGDTFPLPEEAGVPYPEPVAMCDLCAYWRECDARRRDDDHLSLVAAMPKSQRDFLAEHGITTVTEFGGGVELPPCPTVAKRESLLRSQHQARVQLIARDRSEPYCELPDPVDGEGLNLLPEPNPGDVFFDIESARYVEPDGFEYLFGYVLHEDGDWQFKALWARDPADERRIFETFVDAMVKRRERFPGMHIYHYAPYEPGALKRLMQRYGSRQDEIDDMLRAELFVDLYRVIRQGVRAGVERYSIKDMEPFFGFERQIELREAGDARHDLERIFELGEPLGEDTKPLEAITERYNEDDCRGTRALRDWLEERRTELEGKGFTLERPQPPEREDEDPRDPEVARLQDALLEGVPDVNRTPEQHASYVLAHALEFHRREHSAAWWEFFRLKNMPMEDYAADRSALQGLQFVEELPLEGRQKSPREVYTFPRQEFVWDRGAYAYSAAGDKLGEVEEFDADARRLVVTKPGAREEPLPSHVFMYAEPMRDGVKRQAIRELADDVLRNGWHDRTRFAAVKQLLLRETPPCASGNLVEPGESTIDAATRILAQAESVCLAVQGPPGAGKSYTAAKVIDGLLQRGLKVGVTALSHAVIANLLCKVRDEGTAGRALIARKPKTGPSEPLEGVTDLKTPKKILKAFDEGKVNVFGATGWFWAGPEARGLVDVLVVDEAGQLALADAVAAGVWAPRVLLVGDPQQLEQPIQATHPDGTGLSALEHLLEEKKTIPKDKGLFLEETWRMAPAITEFTSELFYEGRLASRPHCEERRLDGFLDGAGLWWAPVEHRDNSNESPEEVAQVRALATRLVTEGRYRHENGDQALTEEDVLIVAPYNAQVYALREALPGFRIGTVDKFQGQEAPVVIVSLTTSSADDAPRGMEFLYSLNRLNVATSRAKAACILVASPALFEPDCKTPRQIQLANALCRYREVATRLPMGGSNESA